MYQLADLLHLMARLRDPQHGCPWDLQQDYASIVPHTLEEAYEVADAIERRDFAHLPGELGDLLFQVVYYSQLAREEGRFDFATVVDAITRKLVRRHPHVFPDGDLYGSPELPRLDEAAIKQRWEQIKAEERAEQAAAPEQLSLLDDVPHALPALSRAAKLQKRAAGVGFDWPEALPVVDKLHEELNEVLEAMSENDPQAIAEEIGDLLFVVVNLARHLKVDPENALRAANGKFERRFRFIEQALRDAGRSPESCDLEELDALWDAAKKAEQPLSCG
ncbi:MULTISPECIES: nucleoside triphosphate pyrophosphohydrolase [Stutzerimonas]|jgi:ATP diphosphatase|uniref:nucleoside triphosphate pyrophosphohydrolase n=1 Tax=Stutzerimonas TaxID=2901164 RepID=UPI000597CD98|nr:nucleoside triphosphate pyrophosphohydrolase [Stutzerimonas balearica]KIL04951.1 nucleoside triphosphate hydrolase [Stutzerimonas stutzeri]MBZ5755729.1 nucleoside triphosphate pyrophosphohydrolase [Pseudomonas sp. S5(2021)]WIX04127.1 nucleoside triphosphate pyrophosphohydrolase [Pseudomonas sp. AR5]HAF94388.1 nucleoside triphosphate pyrophosphohydrolase [Pseudomonas sp.]MBC7199031.1 nucleoside triphosphate pyrophosphohydrolase [Stutzerimonas balearica]